jgi:phytoene synthase
VAALTYAGKQVREEDKDRFYLSLKADPAQRKALWALFAFNLEIAKTRSVVTETTIGLIRLQWWRDALTSIYKNEPYSKHQILDDLVPAIQEYNLPKEFFETLLYGREFDLEGVLPASMDGVLKYTDHTVTPLNQLALRILGQGEDSEDTVSRVSQYYGLIGLLRALPYHASERRCFLPADLLAKHDVREGQIYDKGPSDQVSAIILDMINHMEAQESSMVPKAKFLKKQLGMSKLYKQRIKAANYDVFATKSQVKPLFFYFRV